MKHLLLIALFGMFALPSQAQTATYLTQMTGTAVDTVTNTAADTLYLTVKGEKSNITFQYNATKISGTISGAYIQLAGTVDGTKYVHIATDTLADATDQYAQKLTVNSFTKYRVIIKGGGTQSSSYDIWALYRNK